MTSSSSDAAARAALEGYGLHFPVEVRFRDLDLLGHVNNAVYLTYLESARMAWWMRVVGRDDLQGLAMILARTEIDYRSQVVFGERLWVGVRCASMRRSSFVLEFLVVDAASGRVRVQARKVLVHYDYVGQRSSPLPPGLRAAIRAQDPAVQED